MVVVVLLPVLQGPRTDHLAEDQVHLLDHLKKHLAAPGAEDRGQVVAGEGAYQGVAHLRGKQHLAEHLGEHLEEPDQVGDRRGWASQEMEDGGQHLGDHLGDHLEEHLGQGHLGEEHLVEGNLQSTR